MLNAQDTISQAVKYLLKRDKRHQKDLAAAMGMWPAAMSGRMQGQIKWTAKDLDFLATYFNEPLVVFLLERNPPSKQSADDVLGRAS